MLLGEFTCKALHLRQGRMRLNSANPAHPNIAPKDGQEVKIWGVVVASIVEHIMN